jgi:hypothetical protein
VNVVKRKTTPQLPKEEEYNPAIFSQYLKRNPDMLIYCQNSKEKSKVKMGE